MTKYQKARIASVLLCALGITACGVESSAPTVLNAATDVSLAFQNDDQDDITIDDAALTLAVAVLPAPPERLADLASAANLLLGASGAIAPTNLTRSPDVTCADLVGPNGLGIEDVAALFALDTAATSPAEFDNRLQNLLPQGSFQRTNVPTLADLQQCPRVAIPDISNLTLNKTEFAPGDEISLSAITESATGFTEFAASAIAEVDLGIFGGVQEIDLIEPVTFDPQQADTGCAADGTARCEPSVALTLPDSFNIPDGAQNVNFFAELTAKNEGGESESARLPFSLLP